MKAKEKCIKKMTRERLNSFGRGIISPLVGFLSKSNVSPNLVSVFGFVVSFMAAYLYSQGAFRLGAVVLILSGLSDVVDGELARSRNMATSSGALLDSTLDRIADALLFGALIWYYFPQPGPFFVFYFSIVFSFLVSYIRARGEGLGISIKAGPMDRSGRFFYVVVASLIGKRFFYPLMIVFLILAFLTVARRFLLLYNALRQRGS